MKLFPRFIASAISILFISCLGTFSNAQILISAGGSVPVTNGMTFYDAGGAAGNDGNTNHTITLTPAVNGESVCVDFISFITEMDSWGGLNGADKLVIFDGPNTSSTILGSLQGNYGTAYNGSSSNGSWNVGQAAVGSGANAASAELKPGMFCANNSAGILTFQFTDQNTDQNAGWIGNIVTFVKSPVGCNVSLDADDQSICPGDPVQLTANGNVMSASISTDFNNSDIGTGWTASPGSLSFVSVLSCQPNNGFDTHNSDNSIYAWMQNTSGTRKLETIGFNVSAGGWMSFDFREASDDNGSNGCEALDDNEGVYVQYSTNGTTWTNMKLMFPGRESGGDMGTGDYVYDWGTTTLPIPAAAISTNTKFRWIQASNSSGSQDSWGIDNITVSTASTPTITITNQTTGAVVGTSTTIPYVVTVNPSVTTTYRATITDGTTSCYDDITITVNNCSTTPCGSCLSPTCGISGPWTNVDEANTENCTAPGQVVLNPVLTATTYDSYHNVTADANGSLGMIASVYTGSGSTCSPSKSAVLYPTSPCTSGAISPSSLTANSQINYYNPEWYGLTPGATYILKITYTIPTGCSMEDHCVSYYHIPTACSCAAPCSVDSVLCFDQLTYDPQYQYTVAGNSTDVHCYTVDSGPNGFIGLVQQVNGGTLVRDAELFLNSCASASAIQPTNTNANNVASQFNPEWENLTINTAYTMCISVQNTASGPADLIPVTYWSQICCPADAGTVDVYINNINVTSSSNEYTVCWGDTILFATNNDYVLQTASSTDPNGLGYVLYSAAPTNADPASDTGYLGLDYNPATGDVNNGQGFSVGTYWIAALTMDDICNAGSCNTDRGYDVDNDGCFSLGTPIKFTFLPAISINAGSDTTICAGNAITLSATGSTGNITWNNAVVQNQSFTPTDSADYVATLTTTNGCLVRDTVTVDVLPSPIVSAGNDQIICAGDTITLDATGAINISWTGGIQDNIPFVPTADATYIASAGTGSCTDSDTVQITVLVSPTVDFTSDISGGCAPLTVNFTNNSTGSSSCTWDMGNGILLSGCANTSYTFDNDGCYDISLTASNGTCSTVLTQTDMICVEAPPVADFMPSSPIVSELEPIVTFLNNSIGASTYQWTFGDNSAGSLLENPTHNYSNLPYGDYLVTLIAYSTYGCTDEITIPITMVEDLIYYVPNCFTPDGDLYNQTFQPVFTSGYDPYDYQLTIFNRWGEQIFESTKVTEGWNGELESGKLVEEGVYSWKIEFKNKLNDERHTINGHVTLIR